MRENLEKIQKTLADKELQKRLFEEHRREQKAEEKALRRKLGRRVPVMYLPND